MLGLILLCFGVFVVIIVVIKFVYWDIGMSRDIEFLSSISNLIAINRMKNKTDD